MLPIYKKSTEERKKHKQANNDEKVYLFLLIIPHNKVVKNENQKGRINEE